MLWRSEESSQSFLGEPLRKAAVLPRRDREVVTDKLTAAAESHLTRRLVREACCGGYYAAGASGVSRALMPKIRGRSRQGGKGV